MLQHFNLSRGKCIKGDALNKDALKISRRLQVILGLAIALSLILYWRSWKDLPHLFYDIPAGLATGAYLGQIICELKERLFSRRLLMRLALLIPMSIIPAGREFFGWNISGHLSDILAVTLIQAMDERLNALEKIAYALPVPVILSIRLFLFDRKGHMETLNAIGVALILFLCYFIVISIFPDRKNNSASQSSS